ncbi:MAG: DUF4037 domain-containing protein [Candidatus Latescibacteria bacterium]|nr:DUF4037 domain-containing protein [Candidatus Latescibacterota bacterium]
MTEASHWRLAIAQRAAKAYAVEPNVRAVLVGGSVGRGRSDRYSDTELGVFWSELPGEEQQSEVLKRVGGTPRGSIHPLDHTDPGGGYAPFALGGPYTDQADGRIGGYPIELENETVRDTERWLSDVAENFETSLPKQNLICAIRDGIPLYGFELIEHWRSKTADYPTELSLKMIKIIVRGLSRKLARQRIWADRNEPILVNSGTSEIIREILHLLHAVNAEYIADSSKWIKSAIDKLEAKPHALFERLQEVCRSQPNDGLSALLGIVEEIIVLANQRFPELTNLKWNPNPSQWDRPPKGYP